MQKPPSSILTITHWFYLFLFAHVLCWTLAPFLLRYNLPLDSMEGTTWGHQLLLGYDKNPFMNAWLTALAIKISGTSAWAVYLFSQLSVGLCFWAVWKLGQRIFSPLYACVSVMLLEGVQYYHLHAFDFNDNTLELGLWAITIYFFYCALKDKKFWPWLLTGVFAALGVMTKYYTAMLLLPMILFLLIDRKNHSTFKSPFFILAY